MLKAVSIVSSEQVRKLHFDWGRWLIVFRRRHRIWLGEAALRRARDNQCHETRDANPLYVREHPGCFCRQGGTESDQISSKSSGPVEARREAGDAPGCTRMFVQSSGQVRIQCAPSSGVDYAKLFADNLGLLRQVVMGIARYYRLREDEAEDLLGSIQLKLIENDYAALRRFEGSAQLRTYFTTIVAHHLQDERDKRLGKWRPSVFAQRAGPVAELLERLITRDGRTFDEAVRILKTNYLVSESEAELYRMSVGFPHRTGRRFVDIDEVDLPGRADDPEATINRERRALLAQRTSAAIGAACARLGVQDRLLLKLYFQKGLELSKIAKVLKVEQKPLYRRKHRVLAMLADELEGQGISRNEVREILGEDIELDLGGEDDEENRGRASV